jgi:hypothetical protein
MRVRVDGLWQQKHPTPSGASWEYHWHPRGLPADVLAAVSALDLGLGGGGESAFVVGTGWLAWLRTFAAQAPAEQRDYIGVAGVLARGDGDWDEDLPGVLAALPLPAAAPHDGRFADRSFESRPVPAAPVDLSGLDESGTRAEALARFVIGGGRFVAGQAAGDATLPAVVARLLSWLPAPGRAEPRQGVFAAHDGRDVVFDVEDSLAHYLPLAWRPPAGLPPDYPALVWRLCAEACAPGRPTNELFRELGALAEAWEGAPELGRYLAERVIGKDELARCDAAAPAPLLQGRDAGMLFCRVFHYFGRGFLRGDGLIERLARLLALRVVIDHLVRLDDPAAADLPGRHLRRLRYEALLPDADRARILVAARRQLPSLAVAG